MRSLSLSKDAQPPLRHCMDRIQSMARLYRLPLIPAVGVLYPAQCQANLRAVVYIG